MNYSEKINKLGEVSKVIIELYIEGSFDNEQVISKLLSEYDKHFNYECDKT